MIYSTLGKSSVQVYTDIRVDRTWKVKKKLDQKRLNTKENLFLYRNETVLLKENDQKSKIEKNSLCRVNPHEPNFSSKYLRQI